ncbi:MAG TPA: hypothetical protein VJ326_06920 [Thermoplasmata archaeon]|nr:hypothetical protein [Thermoplasmata archaeon]
MRSIALIVAAGILLIFALPLVAPAAGQAPGLPKLSVLVYAETDGGAFVFKEVSSGENRILLPQVPILLNITFRNNETTAGIIHTFTINDENETLQVNSGNISPNATVQLEFIVESIDRIVFGNVSFAPETAAGGIVFYCIPHRGTGMVGDIVLASLAEPEPEKGILLRAYWIGMIGIFAMIGWIGISYFIIKSSSPKFTDQREHVRKGLP